MELAQKVENSATTEFYYDGHTIGRRIFKADGTLFVDKSAVVGETKEDASMVDNSTVQVGINCSFYYIYVNILLNKIIAQRLQFHRAEDIVSSLSG